MVFLSYGLDEALLGDSLVVMLRFPGVEIHESALSDHGGTAEFVYVHGASEGWSGLRKGLPQLPLSDERNALGAGRMQPGRG